MPDRTLTADQLDFGGIELEEGELPDGALLVLRTQMDGSRTRLVVRRTDGLDWITITGMLVAAQSSFVELESENEDEDD